MLRSVALASVAFAGVAACSLWGAAHGAPAITPCPTALVSRWLTRPSSLMIVDGVIVHPDTARLRVNNRVITVTDTGRGTELPAGSEWVLMVKTRAPTRTDSGQAVCRF